MEQTSQRKFASVPEGRSLFAGVRKYGRIAAVSGVFGAMAALAVIVVWSNAKWPAAVLAVVAMTCAAWLAFPWKKNLENAAALRSLSHDLDDSRSKLAHVARAIQEAIWDWNLVDDTTEWSEGAQALFGYGELATQSGNWWLDNIHPDDREGVWTSVQEAMAGSGKYWSGEYRFKRAAGSYAEVHDRALILRDENGKAVRMIGAMADYTQRNLSARALAERERQLRLFFDSALDAMVIQDDMGRYLDVNPAACKLFGLSREQLIGRSGADFAVPGSDYKTPWRKFMTEGRYRGDIVLVRLDGSRRVVDASATANYLPGRHFSILRDITEQRDLEMQLRQAHKMEALGRLAGGIAHDFNNLLNVIVGYSELIDNKLEPNSMLRRYVAKVVESTERAAELTDRMLSFSSNKHVLAPALLDLNAVIAELEETLPQQLGECIDLRIRCAQDLGQVKADRNQVEQILTNLALNARDAMPNGGALSLETARVHLDEQQCKDGIDMVPGDYVAVAVRDSGTGMDASTLAHLFEPFFTTKDVGKGAGLGLATVYGIVRQSGGFIRVQSELGAGTEFKVYLPLAHEPARLTRRSEPVPRSTRGTILLAEDETALREATAEYLQAQGYSVLAAGNGAEALDLARQYHDKIDLLLTDVIMPVMDGKELARKIAGLVPGVKILVVSGYTDGMIMEDDLPGPHAAFMQKPYAFRVLAQKIRELLEVAVKPDESARPQYLSC